MELRFILRGFGAGALGGLLAFAFARIMAEPLIQRAIDYEEGRGAAQELLDKAAGLAIAPAEAEVFSRGLQRGVGIGLGMLLFGLAVGGLFAVAYVLIQRRTAVRPRTLAALLAAAGFVALYLVPFLKYPANPPAVGNDETIGARGALYFAMIDISLACLVAAVLAWRRLAPRVGSWNASLLAGAGFVIVVAVAMAILPPLGHLDANVAEYGRRVAETPLPLRDPEGRIVFPGFDPDLLFKFRLCSVISQLIIWSTIGLAFGALAERLLAYRPRAAEPLPAAAAA